MSESVAAVISTPVRTLSKSSDRSLLSSPDASAPGSPSRPGFSSSPELQASAVVVPVTGAAVSSAPLIPHDYLHQNMPNETAPTALPGTSNTSPGPSGTGTPALQAERVPTAASANAVLSSGTSSTSGNTHSVAASSTSAAPAQASQKAQTPPSRPQNSGLARRPSFGLGFLSSLSSSIRGSHSGSSTSQSHSSGAEQTSDSNVQPQVQTSAVSSTQNRSNPHSPTEPQSPSDVQPPVHNFAANFMSNSPTVANLSAYTDASADPVTETGTSTMSNENSIPSQQPPFLARQNTMVRSQPAITEETSEAVGAAQAEDSTGKDKDGFYSIRLTPIIDHSTSNTGLYFSPMIRRIKPKESISIGRYTEKNKSAAHAPQGSSAPLVFKSKVVSRTHAMFQCNEDGSWFLKDCKSSSGTFLNNVRLSQASQESTLWPLIDGDVVQLGLDYRGGTEEVYRCVKMRCEFNRSWQRKVNQFNLDIHKKMKKLGLDADKKDESSELSECAICLLKLEPCQALFISPCSHSWHYKCIRPIIIKSYPQFYCPNCRCMCDLETDIEDE